MHQRKKKNKTTRKDTTDSEGIQRHLKYIMHKSGKKRTLIPNVKNDSKRDNHIKIKNCKCLRRILQQASAENHFGEEVQDPQNLETRRNTEKTSYNEDVRNETPEFTQKEIQATIDSLKKCKASDNNGIRAENIKTYDETTKEMIRQIFNEVLKQEDCTPEPWRRTRIKLIYKKCGRSW